jgi:hypothetical protein
MLTSVSIVELLGRLKPVDTAFYDHIDDPACLQGTRAQLLSDIERWMMDPDSKTVYWLTGAAGTGKTTVARSIAEMARTQKILGATFFFSYTSDDRCNFKTVIPTIARQLADDHPRLRSRIAAAMDVDETLATAGVAIQAKKLLFETLSMPTSDSPSRLVLVLDALDECKKDRNGIHGGVLIPQLLAALKNAPFVKVFLTSRLEPGIEIMFSDKALSGKVHSLALHRDIDAMTVKSDIAHYLRSELTQLRERMSASRGFPDESSINTLVDRAGTLFIYARAAVEYISDPNGQPDHRLAALIEAKPELSSRQYGPLDSLYSQILLTAHETLKCSSPDLADKGLRSVMIALVLLRQEMTLNELVTLTGVDEATFSEILGLMSAILNYQRGKAEPVRLMHLSFAEYLSDNKRCLKLPKYVVDPSYDHLWLTECCLGPLNARLSVSMLTDEDINTLFMVQPSGFWWYSCRFWAVHWLQHLRESSRQEVVPQALERFRTLALPNWIRVVNLMDIGDFLALMISAEQAFLTREVCFTFSYCFVLQI